MNQTYCVLDIKLHLSGTDYGDFLSTEPPPLHTTTIADKATLKLVKEFQHLRAQATNPLSQFLDYITYGISLISYSFAFFSYQYMIDNVILLITGSLHDSNMSELVEKCHPLGLFDSMATLSTIKNVADLYNTVLVDTPLGPYMQEVISDEDFDEVNIEIVRNTLYKHYLQDFYKYCKELGGATGEIMSELLVV